MALLQESGYHQRQFGPKTDLYMGCLQDHRRPPQAAKT